MSEPSLSDWLRKLFGGAGKRDDRADPTSSESPQHNLENESSVSLDHYGDAEVDKRIRAAGGTNARSISLNELQLTEVPNSVRQLKHLQKLNP
jgi:hypothetical protein